MPRKFEEGVILLSSHAGQEMREGRPLVILPFLIFCLIPRRLGREVDCVDERIHLQESQCDGIVVPLGFPAKYRGAVFDEGIDERLKEICLEISKRYELKFLEIGTDEDHVHFLVQALPTYSGRKLSRW